MATTNDDTLVRQTQEKLLGHMKADYEGQMRLVAAMTQDVQTMLRSAYIRADKPKLGWFDLWRRKRGAIKAVEELWVHAEIADKLRKRFNDGLDSVSCHVDVDPID